MGVQETFLSVSPYLPGRSFGLNYMELRTAKPSSHCPCHIVWAVQTFACPPASKHLGLGPWRSSHGELMRLSPYRPQTLSSDHRRPISREQNASCPGPSPTTACICSKLNGHLRCLWGQRMGLPRTAWLQAAASVLREAGGGGARCLWLLEKPKMAGIQHT